MGLCLLILLAIVLGPPATASAIPELRDHAFTHLADEPMAAAHSRVPPAGGPVKISERYGRLPLAFEVNDGQTDPRVKFLARAGGHRLFLTSTEAVMVFRPSRSAPSPLRRGSVARSERSLEERRASAGPPSVVRMRLLGGNPAARVTGGEELPGRVNYFIGNDPARWHTNIRTYAKVKYENVYPGIDLVYYGNAQRLEYDVIVGPGVDPGVITIAFEGVDALEVDASGDVVMHTPGGIVRQARPFIYQEINGVKQPVSGRHRLKGAQQLGFEVTSYDRSRPLVIDPLLVYSPYLGGDGSDAAFGIAVDAEGNAYVTGQTLSVNFPTASPLDPFLDDVRRFDAFVTKLNPEGTAAVYSTFLGGSSSDLGAAIAVDSARSAYVAGSTNSPDFPTTPGAFSRVLKSPRGAFVLKLNGAGSALIYSTYLGGDTSDDARHIALGLDGSAFVSGITFSRDFPTTSGAVQRALGGGITDAFVTRLSPSGSDLVYSTYLGGSAEEFDSGIAVDAASNAYVSGTTSSSDFPTTPGAFQTTAPGGGDAFVTKLNPDGSAFVYSTYLGGRFSDSGGGLAVDADGNALVTGDSGSPDFPVVRPIQSAAGGGGQRARVFVTKLDAQGAGLLYSTQLGGRAPSASIRPR